MAKRTVVDTTILDSSEKELIIKPFDTFFEDNVIFVSKSHTFSSFKVIYERFHYLQNHKNFDWILLNLCTDGSRDVTQSEAVKDLLMSSKKPIKTQVIGKAYSYGIDLSVIGEERAAWPSSEFMFHPVSYIADGTLDEHNKSYKRNRILEERCDKFLKSRIGEEKFANLLEDLKKNNYQDLFFDAAKAVDYGLVHKIGIIEPLRVEFGIWNSISGVEIDEDEDDTEPGTEDDTEVNRKKHFKTRKSV